MLWPALGFVSGVWLLQQCAVLPNPIYLFLPSCLLGFILLADHPFPLSSRWRQFCWSLLALLLGFAYASWRADWRMQDELDAQWQGKPIQIIGVVASLPQVQTDLIRFKFDVEKVLTPGVHVPSHIALAQYLNSQFAKQRPVQALQIHPGQRWQFSVRLKRPHGLSNPHGRDSEAWALANGIGATGSLLNVKHHLKQNLVGQPKYLIDRAREKVAQRMQSVLLDAPYQEVLKALSIGDDSNIDAEDWQVFLHSGVNHLISISGLHITMIASFFAGLVWLIWRKSMRLSLLFPARQAAALVGALLALVYALLAGFSVPTQRTVYMLMTIALALMLKREIALSRILLLALLVVVILDPWAVLAPGFCLSFGAVALFIYALGYRLSQSNWLSAGIRTQWVATIGLLPLTIAMFQQVSLISPIANILAIPIISLAVVPLTLLGAMTPIDVFLHAAHWLMRFTMFCLQSLSALSWSNIHLPPVGPFAIGLSVLGVVILLLPKGFPLRWMGVLMLAPLFAMAQPSIPTGAIKASVIDVGQGLAVLVRTRHHQLLYDTGRMVNAQINSGNRVIQPYLHSLGINSLDMMVVSHHDSDHYGGMESLLMQIPTNQLLASFDLPIDVNRQLGFSQRCVQGQSWFWDGVKFEVLYPDEDLYHQAEVSDNNRSCVLRVSNACGSLLLTGDIELQAEQRLLESQQKIQSTLMTIPHHGSKTSSSQALIDAVKPRCAIATVGYMNRYHHPRADIMQRYQRAGVHYFRSDWDGAVLIDFPANPSAEPAVKAWRSSHARYWQDRESLAENRLTR